MRLLVCFFTLLCSCAVCRTRLCPDTRCTRERCGQVFTAGRCITPEESTGKEVMSQ